MPIYEYVCKACGKRSSLLFRSFASVEAKPRCPHCHSLRLSRQLSRPGLVRVSPGASEAGQLRAVDPRKAVESLSAQYDKAGIDPGSGFEEVAQRAAAGDSPETLQEAVKEMRQNESKKRSPSTRKKARK